MLKIKLAQYQDAIAIFSKALTCCTNEPDVIRAKVAAYCLYAKSLIAWNAGKIDETTKYLDEALDISKINNLSLANSINLILELRSSDKLMAETFNSEDFVELQSNSEKTFKAFKALYDRFADKPVSEEASEILYSKAICSEALYDALNAKISTDTLQEARAFLKKRRLFNSVIAVNALENFILYLQMALEQNKRLPDIPKDTEKFLLNQLKLTNLLGYDLSQKITIDNYANSPIKLKHPLSIIPIDFPGKKEEKIRVCCVQIKFEVALKNNKDEHGYVLEDKEVIKEKVFSALEFAKQNNVNIVCFPELSTTEEWVSDAKGKYGEMVLIFGSYYKNSYNTCPVIIEGKEHFVQKINPSPLERETTQGTGMRSGDSLKIFNTRFGKFVVLLCYDFSEDLHCITKNANPTVKDIDFIIIPELNDRNDIFEKIADAACIDLPCPYFVLVNASNKGKKKQGCSCVIGLEDRDVLSKYVKEGTKPSDETDYKLIEAKQGESLFIVDLDIKIKGIKFPVEPKMNVIGFYILNQAYNWIKI